jgi:uncharacterized membrane protein YccC
MTKAETPSVAASSSTQLSALQWLRSKDPDLLVVKRSIRAAVVIPSVFAIAHSAFSNPQVGLFGAFGSFALLLFVEFTGRVRTRLISYGTLYLVGSCLIVLGTLASSHGVPAVATMAIVGFCVLFAGIVAPQAATGSTAALLTFVLSVAIVAPASAVGPRLLGWTLAAAFSIAACQLIWPAPWHDNLRRRLSAAVSSIARLADAHAEGRREPEAHTEVQSELSHLRDQFSATPYPPTGAAPRAVALSKLVGRVEWVAGNAAMVGDRLTAARSPSRAVTAAIADTLHRAASVICDSNAYPVDDSARIGALQDSSRRLDETLDAALDADVSVLIETASDGAAAPGRSPGDDVAGDGSIAAALDPAFQTRALGIATEMVADATLEAAGADAVRNRRLAMAGAGTSQIRRRLISHLSFRSVWFRNALRGAVGLTLAVTVIEITNVQHGFWVVLGTLSVLRSNALGTGATALRAVGGTAVGFVLGSALVVAVGTHTVVLWLLLPLAVLLAAMAPTMISFAAGQAGFTLMVVILFNILDPVGWRVGLVRIEDVAIGCAVSVVVGLLFWPRGATAALGRALSAAFVASSGYLADAVDRLTVMNRHVDTKPGEVASTRAYLLLDDAFREFLAERGAKVVPIEVVARLFTGSNRIRLAAYTLATLPSFPPAADRPEIESVTVAGAVLRDSYASSHRWYEEFAEMLAGQRDDMDQPPSHEAVLHDVLRTAFEEARTQRRDDGLRRTLQMLWADELLESQSQVQTDLASSADLFVRHKRKGFFI